MIRQISLDIGPLPTEAKLTIEGEPILENGGVHSIDLRVRPHQLPELTLGVYSEAFRLNGPVSVKILEDAVQDRAFVRGIVLPTEDELRELLPLGAKGFAGDFRQVLESVLINRGVPIRRG